MKSIRIKLLLVFLFIGLLPAITIGFISIRVIYNAFYYEISENLGRFSESKEGQIYAYLDSLKQQTFELTSEKAIQSFFQSFHTGKLDVSNRSLVENFLKKNQKISQENIVATMLLDETGAVIASTLPEYLGVNESEKEYFQFGKLGFYWTDYTLSFEEEKKNELKTSFVIGTAVRDNERGGFLGVIANFYDTKQIQNILSGEFQLSQGAVAQNKPSFNTLKVYLVNKKGELLFSTRQEEINAQPFSALIKNTFLFRKCLIAKEERVALYKNYAGEKVIGASGCFSMNGWTLFTEVNAGEALYPIQAVSFRLTVITELFVLFITVISLLFSQRITHPIKVLRKNTAQVALGNFHVEIEHIQSKDEIGQLSEDFNQMTRKLRSFYIGLEQKIKERTKELECKVKELERLNRLMVGRELIMISLKKKIREFQNLSRKKIKK